MRRVALLLFLMIALAWEAPARAAEPLPQPTGPVLLTISGAIEQTNAPGQARFDQAMLGALGKTSVKTGSAWADQPQVFEGVLLSAVLDRVGAKGTTMIASALNDYQIDIPFEDLHYQPLLAMSVDGKMLSVRDKGPLWIIYPRDSDKALQDNRYDSRWVWQLNRLRVE